MKKHIVAVTAFFTMTAMLLNLCGNAEAKVRMSRKNLTLEVSKSHTLKLKGVKGKIIWKSSKPGVARVNKKGKITAVRKGKTTVTAKAGKKLYRCAVTVRDKKKKETLNMVTPKPSEPAVVQNNPAVTPAQPTATPGQPVLESQQPTPVPDLPTAEPSNKPTPVPAPETPKPDGGFLSGPCVMEYAAYMDCRISDIDRGGFELLDENGENIRAFGVEVGSLPKIVVYDGILTDSSGIPFDRYSKFSNYAAKGEPIDYSDIQPGDIVDVVYGYSLEHVDITKRKYFCMAINVHKREGDG